MSDIGKFLEVARKRALIDNRTHAALEGLRVELAGGEVSEDARSAMLMETAPQADSEAPRFIRGFHDVLITIGIIIAIGGLWALGSALVVIPAIIVLAEYFVRRQRLALPAFTLTVLLALAVGNVAVASFDASNSVAGIGLFAALAAALAAFFWRYRVPVALASLIVAGFGLAFFLILAAMGVDTWQMLDARLMGAIGLALTIGLFAVAMRYDLADPSRVSRSSDIAFWLHLTTAPLLIYSLLVVLFGEDGFWWADKPEMSEALTAIIIVILMIVIGIVIDRRAFVTSGLVSLGAALGILTQETGVDISSVTAFAFLAVGVIVLLLGAGWQKLRGVVVSLMPHSWRAKLPPAAG